MPGRGWCRSGDRGVSGGVQRRSESSADEEDDRCEYQGDQRGPEPDREIGTIRDGADDARADGVAESMDEEELAGERGGANFRANRIDGCGVDWPGAEEDEEGLADLALGALNRRTSNHGCNANVRTVVPPNSHYIRYRLGQR